MSCKKLTIFILMVKILNKCILSILVTDSSISMYSTIHKVYWLSS